MGLDISTSYTGISILADNGTDRPTIHLLDHIDYKKCKTFWDKVDLSKKYFDDMNNMSDKITKTIPVPDIVYIEDPAKKFSVGASSANTIVTLAKFNGLLSYFAYKWYGEPRYLAPQTCRRLCGLKMLPKKKDPNQRTHKQQTFDTIMANDLSHITWPTKRRSANLVDYAFDVVDSYVIAKAGIADINVQK